MIIGQLRGFDQATNLVLANSLERVFSSAAGVAQVALGLYIIRGDNMYAPLFLLFMSQFTLFLIYFSAVVGEIDEEQDTDLDLPNTRADPLAPIFHY